MAFNNVGARLTKTDRENRKRSRQILKAEKKATRRQLAENKSTSDKNASS